MMAYLGAWPFSSLVPAIMTREALCKIVTLLSKRYEKVLKGGRKDRAKIIFRSLAVYDRRVSQIGNPVMQSEGNVEAKLKESQSESLKPVSGFTIDQAGLDEEDEDDDEMALAALEALDAIEVFSLDKALTASEGADKISLTQIPLDNFRSLIQLLLLITPLSEQESLAGLAQRSDEEHLHRIQEVADCILWAFAPERNAGINFSNYKRIVSNALPHIFEGFNPLFEHFLFSKHLDLSKRKRGTSNAVQKVSAETVEPLPLPNPEPLLLEYGDILDETVLCQMSFFIPSAKLFRRLRLLYRGSSDGFSINSFEQRVLNWRAPTIFLVSGSRLGGGDAESEASHASFPPRRFAEGSKGNSRSDRVVFGAMIDVPWKHTYKEPFGDSSSLLFQLEPVHSVFKASSLNHDYATLTRLGISFGSPIPHDKPVAGLPGSDVLPLGAVSLNLDGNLESGVFMNDSAGGGAYSTVRSRLGADGAMGWEERFEVEHVEVWGCGGDEAAKEQRERWKWEEREAMARRGVNKSEDRDQAYALLEMAGLVNQNRSGGSMA